MVDTADKRESGWLSSFSAIPADHPPAIRTGYLTDPAMTAYFWAEVPQSGWDSIQFLPYISASVGSLSKLSLLCFLRATELEQLGNPTLLWVWPWVW